MTCGMVWCCFEKSLRKVEAKRRMGLGKVGLGGRGGEGGGSVRE